MKVMQILPAMDIGGVERGVLDLVVFFKKSGIENIVVSSGGRLVEELRQQGITHYRLAVHKKSPLSLLSLPKLRKIIQQENVDIVHARSRVPGWISFFATRASRTHFITTAHGVYKNPIFSDVMGWGKYVICPSGVVARHMKNNFGVAEEKIRVIPRWVDLERFKFKDYCQRRQSNIIVSIGRISATKGYEHLIKGFRRVVRFNPYFKLKIVGSADKSKISYFEYLKTLVNRFSLNYNVEFVGFRPNVESILQDARLLIAPSIIEESFGRVVIEAMASGVPVVATNLGGFREIIKDGDNGILVEPANSQAIAEAILKIVKDVRLAEKLAKAGRQKVETVYTMQRCLTETKEVYERTQRLLRILVIKISSLGDLILTFPAFREIRDKFPQAKISLLTSKNYHPLLQDCPYIDELITLERNYKRFNTLRLMARTLRRSAFDYIIDLQNNHFSHLISFLSFPRYSFGYNLRWGFLLTNRVIYNRYLGLGPLESQEQILQLLGVRFRQKKLIFWEQRDIKSFSLPKAKLIGINICASRRWHSKNWPLKNIICLIELLHKQLPEVRVILFGEKYACQWAEKIEQSLKSRPLNLCGKTSLADLAQIIRRLEIFITPDTATLHLACALGISTIGLFGPTDPARHTVKSDNLHIIVEELPCSFCYRSKCRLDKENLCLEKITPQIVFNKIREILKK